MEAKFTVRRNKMQTVMKTGSGAMMVWMGGHMIYTWLVLHQPGSGAASGGGLRAMLITDLMHVYGFILLYMAFSSLLSVFRLYYTVTDDKLVIRKGMKRQEIALEDIHEMTPVRSQYGDPVLNQDRILVRFRADGDRDGCEFLSPAEEDRFRKEVEGRVPTLQHGGSEAS